MYMKYMPLHRSSAVIAIGQWEKEEYYAIRWNVLILIKYQQYMQKREKQM